MLDKFDDFHDAFIECLYGADCGAAGQPPMDAELSPELAKRIEADCYSFYARMYFYIEPEGQRADRAGRDFYLTRQGHGAGFWDGGWPIYGETLTKISKGYGSVGLYLSDNGEIDA
jgi:hypothetical protein